MPALRIRVGLVVKPLMYGLAYSSSMLPVFAPSAKILTRSPLRDFTSGRRCARISAHASASDADAIVVARGRLLGVRMIDKKRGASGALAGFDVPPSIADHEAAR